MAKRPIKPLEGPLPLREAEVLSGCKKLLTLLKNQGKLTWRRIHVGGMTIRGRQFKNPDMAGLADLLIFLPRGVTLHCELKATKGHMRFEQTEWMRELSAYGHHYFLIRSVDELISILNSFGVQHWSFPVGAPSSHVSGNF